MRPLGDAQNFFNFEPNEANLQPVKNYFNPMLLKEVLTVPPIASYA